MEMLQYRTIVRPRQRIQSGFGCFHRALHGLLLLCGCAVFPLLAVGAERHVVVIGVDGLYPPGIEDAKTPNIHAMMKDGAWSFHARAVFPTVSSPNWASMIMGAPVEMTGVTSNEWQPKGAAIAPACEATPGIFPTIFGLEHEQHPEAKMGIFTDWADFVRLVEPGAVPTVQTTDGEADKTFDHAMEYFKSEKPEFLFIHLDHVDHAGHTSGWGTPAYIEAVEKTDRMVGEFRSLIESMHLEDSTTIFLTADHGGLGKRHGGLTMSETQIPWIVVGPAIRKDHQIADQIMQYDTAATLAYVLNVKASSCWRGRPVVSAFK
jgi:predicted AlkP superfamily pyrophosphatase or phosphodiesterase